MNTIHSFLGNRAFDKWVSSFFSLIIIAALSWSYDAQAQTTVFAKGNVSIVQSSDGWQMLHGRNVIAHGEGNIDVNNFAPTVQGIIDQYAQKPVSLSKSGSRTLSKSTTEAEYLIKTQWNQMSPFNDLCPTIDGEHTPAGCVTISSAQVLNYYRVCNPLHPNGTHSIYSNVQSPYMQLIEHKDDLYTYTYDFSYTPDFDKINSDNAELAKFIFAIALSQKAYFDALGSTTSYYTQSGAFDNYFGYDYDICEDHQKMDEVIISAINDKKPAIISDNLRNHSYIIDGYNSETKEYHVNYGWGGDQDGWYATTVFNSQDFSAVIIAYPSDGSRVKLQDEPKYCYIKNKYDSEYSRYDMKRTPIESGSDKNYIPESLLKLIPGEYEFYLEYADGSTIAPKISGDNTLWQLNTSLIGQGEYQRTPAKIVVKNICTANITHSQEMGYIQIQGWGFTDIDFPKFNLSLIIDGKNLPMEYDAQREEYSLVVDCTPGTKKFQIKNNLYNKAIGIGVYANYECYDIFYTNTGNNMTYYGNIERYEDKEEIPIKVLDYAEINNTQIPCKSTKLQFYFTNNTLIINNIGYTAVDEANNYTVTLKTDNAEHGSVTGGGTYGKNSEAIIYAKAKEGYGFASWSDGNPNNPRTINIQGNVTLTAQFAKTGTEPEQSITMPKYLHIVSADNVDTKYNFDREDGIYAKKEVEINAGLYKFYFENADGSTFALTDEQRISTSQNVNSNVDYGHYVNQNTKSILQVDQNCVANFVLYNGKYINIYGDRWKGNPITTEITLPKYLHIVDAKGNDTKHNFAKGNDGDAANCHLKAGEYSIYFENADGSTYALFEWDVKMAVENYYQTFTVAIPSSQTKLITSDICDISFIINDNRLVIYGYNFTYPPTVSAPTAKALTYNGKAQTLVQQGFADYGTMKYSTDGNNFSTNVPTGTNVGKYTVYYIVEDDNNGNALTNAQSIEINIAKGTPKITAPTANSLTANGKAQALVTAGSTNFGTLTYSLDGTNFSAEIPTGTDAGSYTVHYKVDESDNWNVATGSVDVTIKKADDTPTPVSEISGAANEKVWAYDRTVIIETQPDTKYTVIDINGRIIAATTTKSTREELQINQAGLYIVIINGRQHKAVVK